MDGMLVAINVRVQFPEGRDTDGQTKMGGPKKNEFGLYFAKAAIY